MFIPHVIVPHRRDGRRPSRRQRLGAVLGAVTGGLASAIIGAGYAVDGSRNGLIALACVIAGVAVVGGIVLAKVVGRQGKV
jgi:hypothetical protein